jgi:aspartate ammonia-lyase
MRAERDFLGTVSVQAAAYYGAHAARAIENFPITGRTIAALPALVSSMAAVKQVACMANCDLGLLDAPLSASIVQACAEIGDGAMARPVRGGTDPRWRGNVDEQNADDVIVNRALEIVGYPARRTPN